MKNEKTTTRREFLSTLSKTAAGVAVAGVASSLLTSCGKKEEAPAASQAAPYPWKYVKIDDIEELKAHTYDIWYKYSGCGAAGLGGVIEMEAKAAGTDFPYRAIDGRMMAAAHAGWGIGDLCGSIAGAVAAMGLFVEPKDIDKLRDKLYAWYREQPFPNFKPEADKIGEPYKSTSTVAHSVDCRDSVGNYLKATGYKMSDPGRKARCASLTAEVVAETIHILNVYFGYETEAGEPTAAAETALGPNEYIGTANSEIGGELKVKVTMDGKKIKNVTVISHHETAGISDPALKDIPAAIVKKGSADVDVVSGATKTSEAIIKAVKDALSKVK